MIRKTKKLLKAQEAIRKFLNKEYSEAQTALIQSADAYYDLLEKNNYFWNSQNQKWEKAQPAEPPKQVIEIRIRTEGEWLVNPFFLIQRFERAMDAIRLKAISKSKPYTQRPPNQLDSSIYYKFIDEIKEEYLKNN